MMLSIYFNLRREGGGIQGRWEEGKLSSSSSRRSRCSTSENDKSNDSNNDNNSKDNDNNDNDNDNDDNDNDTLFSFKTIYITLISTLGRLSDINCLSLAGSPNQTYNLLFIGLHC